VTDQETWEPSSATGTAARAGWPHRHRDVSGWPRPLGITAIARLAGGMTVGRLTGRPILRSGLRQLALGAVAAGITFTVGSLIGHHAPEPVTTGTRRAPSPKSHPARVRFRTRGRGLRGDPTPKPGSRPRPARSWKAKAATVAAAIRRKAIGGGYSPGRAQERRGLLY